jgi:hypothetical protein
MQLDIADGTFFDEDLQVDITHSSWPTPNTWQQVLQGGAEIPIFYRSGSVWKRTTPTKYPIKQGTLAQYNLNTAGNWSTPDLATNKYGVTWIVATNNLNYPVIGIMGQKQYDNLNKVAEDTWAALDLANLPIFEIRPLWKVAYLVSNGFANTPKAAIREVVDLRVVGSTATGLLTTPTDHGSLYGLSDDDHTQYFNETRGDARYLQLTGGSLSGALSVTGIISGTTFSGSGASLTSIPNSATTATSANTVSAIVARDASGNFTAGTITAALTGNASTATTLQTARSINGVPFNGSSDITISVVGASLAPVLVATTASGTLASSFANGQLVDGVTLATGNRVLIKNQTAAAENGIYTVNATGVPTRAIDANSSSALAAGMVGVQRGAVNGGKLFSTTFKSTDTLDTTGMNWFEVFNSNTAIPNTSTTATSANTANTIVSRDASGNFTAGTITAALTGNASTATTLATARNINGVSFNGSANITVPAAAGTLTGATLASGVTASSLTSVGTLTSLTVSGLTNFTGTVTNTSSHFLSTGSGAAFFARDRDGTARDAGLYMSSNFGRLYHSSYGDVLTFNSSGQVNVVAGIYTAGGGYIGRAAAGFGPFSTDNRAPALLSGAGTNWIHFNWDGAFRCYVDSTLVKTFVINHPDDPDKYLVHACAEGPTADVFYRGEARLEEGIARIDLPDYFESLTELEGRTVQITPIIEHGEAWKTANLAASRVENGCFYVFQTGGMMNNEQPFWWRVDAVRKGTAFNVEPSKSAVTVAGEGPYTYIAAMEELP